MQLVTEDYGLESLSIDSSISYDKAIVCCENLLASSDSVRYMLSGVRVCIAPYFAVMSDGEMYIMWDWVSDGWGWGVSAILFVFFKFEVLYWKS